MQVSASTSPSSLLKDRKKLFDSVEKWNNTEAHTWISLATITNDKTRVCYTEGVAGVGKSHNSTELAIFLRLATGNMNTQNVSEDPIVIVNGKQTDLAFFNFLNQYQDRVIIFDDIATLSTIQLNILKDLTGESRKSIWESSVNKEKREIKFNGSVFINTNTDDKNKNRHLQAVKSRSYVFSYFHSPVRIKEVSHSIFEQERGKNLYDIESWRIIRNRIIAMKDDESSTALTKKEIDKVEAFCSSVRIDHHTNVSLRDIKLILDFMKWFKKFWGTLNYGIFEKGIGIARQFYANGEGQQTSGVLKVFNEMVEISDHDQVKRLEFAHTLRKIYGYSLATAQSKITGEIISGKLAEGDNSWYLQKPQNIVKNSKVKISDF
ncbi:MAG: hypothetical protein GY870_05580 [archaeon]|nr:hypothetical protein [archaeon]